MKRLLAILCLLLTYGIPAFATFGSATAWDVQATGSNTNGGCFDSGVGSPGTDESMGAGTAGTLTTASSTTGTSSPAFTSTTHGPGNCVYVISGTGCTVGPHEMTSQAAGVGTFESAVADMTGRTCVIQIGGSLLTIAQAITNAVASNVIYIQKGTYTLTTGFSPSVALSFLGYQTAHADLDSAAWSTWHANAPLITTATNSIKLFNLPQAKFVMRNLLLSHTAGTRAECIFINSAAVPLLIVNVSMDGCSRGISAANRVDPLIMLNSEIKNWTTNGLFLGNIGGNPHVYIGWSWIHDAAAGTTAAVYLDLPTSTIDHSVVSGSAGIGVYYVTAVSSGSHSITHSTIANNSGNNIQADEISTLVLNSNIIYGSTAGYGFLGPGGSGVVYPATYIATNNGWGGNFLGDVHNTGATTGYNPVTITASPFKSATDFGLNSTAGGGAACKAAGFPGVFAGGSFTGYPDLGAVESQASSGSASATSACFK